MTPATLRAWRAALALSQREAAAALGLTKRHYQNLEAGTTVVKRTIELACAELTRRATEVDEVPTA